MIIVPEIKTVVILVPRTGSGSLRRAVCAKYPKAMLIYRHMEADGIPLGYDHWRRVGLVRDPLDRLWSLYKFLRNFAGPHDPTYIAEMRRSTERPFEDWILNNETVFTSPYDRSGRGRFFPEFTVRHALPENRKSQMVYLRPDLGTTVYRYDQIWNCAGDLGVDLAVESVHNATDDAVMPPLSSHGRDYMQRVFAWDYRQTDEIAGKRQA